MNDGEPLPQAEPAPQPEVASAPAMTAGRLDAEIEAWWQAHFPGSPVARVTEAWNHAAAAKDDLKRRLSALVTGA